MAKKQNNRAHYAMIWNCDDADYVIAYSLKGKIHLQCSTEAGQTAARGDIVKYEVITAGNVRDTEIFVMVDKRYVNNRLVENISLAKRNSKTY